MSGNIINFESKAKPTAYDNVTESIYTAIDELATVDDGLEWEPDDLDIIHSDLVAHNPKFDSSARKLLDILWHRVRVFLSPMIKASSIDYNPGLGLHIKLTNMNDGAHSGLSFSFTVATIDENSLFVEELVNLSISVLCGGMEGDRWPRKKPKPGDARPGGVSLREEPFDGRGRIKVLLDTFYQLAEVSDGSITSTPIAEHLSSLIFHTLNQNNDGGENIVCLYTLSVNNKYLVTESNKPLL